MAKKLWTWNKLYGQNQVCISYHQYFKAIWFVYVYILVVPLSPLTISSEMTSCKIPMTYSQHCIYSVWNRWPRFPSFIRDNISFANQAEFQDRHALINLAVSCKCWYWSITSNSNYIHTWRVILNSFQKMY